MGETKKREIFTPLNIGKVRIENRIAMAPMATFGLLNPDGTLTQRVLDYFIERAKGGVGLIISTCFKVENEIETLVPSFPLLTPAAIAPLSELSETLHSLGTKIFVQLTPGLGRVGSPVMLMGPPVAASEGPNFWDPSLTCRALSVEEIEKIVKSFGDAAELLMTTGVDGIEFHAHEGYLFDQFTTSLWNERTDRYGGDLENRMRFPIEVLEEIRRRTGDNLAVEYRFGVKHYVKGPYSAAVPNEEFSEAGRDMDEGLQMARMLEAAGFDALHVDAGCYDSWYWAHPPGYLPYGCLTDLVEAAKKAVDIPIIGVGRLDDPQVAVDVVEKGKMDVVAIGRGLLADAYWAKKLERNQIQDIRPCIGCHDGCLDRIFQGKPLSCAVNPSTGRERIYRLHRTERPGKVMVIGGGVAGLEAARVAALKGHAVELFEKTDVLGGHLIEATVPAFKENLGRLLKWYLTQLESLKIDIRLETEITPERMRKQEADAVIMATGSDPLVPKIQGIDRNTAITVVDVFRNRKDVGGEVIVIGGGLVGCETALWLAQQGKKVSVVEVLPEVMMGANPVPYVNRTLLFDLLNFNGIEILTNQTLSEVSGNQAMVVHNETDQEQNLSFESLIFATGFAPQRKLYEDMIGTTPSLYLIGDAREPRNVMGAIWDAYEVARTL